MKTYIMVAGHNYDFTGTDFHLFSVNRMRRLLAAGGGGEDLKFILFDFTRGRISTREFSFTGGGRTEKAGFLTPRPLKPITKASYHRLPGGGFRWKDGQRDVMSILDVYQAVQRVGASAPGSLMELSIFSHAWMGGPILVNSYDDGEFTLADPMTGEPRTFPVSQGARDPDDMDPRSKDFHPPTMSRAALQNFRRAFHPEGCVWIWGCGFPRVIHGILTKIQRHPRYRDVGVTDDTVFTFKNFSSDEAAVLERTMMQELGGPLPDRRDIRVTFGLLRAFFCKMTVGSYSHLMAKNSGVKTYGAVMGTYSIFDRGALPLLRVEPRFKRHFAFYENYLGFEFDPEGRNFGLYRPDFTCEAVGLE